MHSQSQPTSNICSVRSPECRQLPTLPPTNTKAATSGGTMYTASEARTSVSARNPRGNSPEVSSATGYLTSGYAPMVPITPIEPCSVDAKGHGWLIPGRVGGQAWRSDSNARRLERVRQITVRTPPVQPYTGIERSIGWLRVVSPGVLHVLFVNSKGCRGDLAEPVAATPLESARPSVEWPCSGGSAVAWLNLYR